MACCIGARLVNSILKALNMPDLKVTLWSDSTTALWWIKEYGNWSVFVANRVKEIRQLTQIQSWKYVPGNMNIVDLLSRGCSPRQMLNSEWRAFLVETKFGILARWGNWLRASRS
ncbi:integrase catalytic domain-containing protein [Trichonephila inaurata madagascariensis]|uniref:Integrase catalytic domain-containing protein n=1 Tax=Trichonephila inaurata madagascariensis TaxID=2747483 RepID=A0A8X6YI55_9ARAC|nr:integrase catalytic domain-containing protein [Trichonephila inaurata madagascariensis]